MVDCKETINCGVLSEELCPGSSHTVTLECRTNGIFLRWCGTSTSTSTSPEFSVIFDGSYMKQLNATKEHNGFSGKLTGNSSEGYTSSLTFNSSLLQPGWIIVCKNISGLSTPCNTSELSCPVKYLGQCCMW